MIYDSKTNAVVTDELPVSDSTGAIEEGLFLIGAIDSDDGELKASVGSTASTDKFIGVSFNQRQTPETSPYTETITPALASTDATYPSADLTYTPNDDIAVYNGTTLLTAVTSTASITDATMYYLDGSTVYVYTSVASTELTVRYRYTLTVPQARALMGDHVTPTVTAETGSVSVILRGDVYTSCFVASDDWDNAAANATLYVNSDGYLTLDSTTGFATVPGHLKAIPTTQIPYLGVSVNVQ